MNTLKDVTLARAKFENRRGNCAGGSHSWADLPSLMLEQALFEEEQGQVAKARLLYETLAEEVAPGHLKSQLASISFEKRQGNTDTVFAQYDKAYKMAIASKNERAVTLLAV